MLRRLRPQGIRVFGKIESSYFVTVKNDGDRQVAGARLIIPYMLGWCLAQQDGGRHCQTGAGPIALGDIAPLESVSLTAWAGFEPSPRSFEGIHLTHSQGIGAVRFQMIEGPQSRSSTFFSGVVTSLIAVTMYALLNLWLKPGSYREVTSRLPERETDPGSETSSSGHEGE